MVHYDYCIKREKNIVQKIIKNKILNKVKQINKLIK